MKLRAYLLLALLIASTAATASFARDGGSTAYDRWEQRLRARVAALHSYPMGMDAGAGGDVVVGFRLDRNGRPADISIQQSSGQPIFDRAALRLVHGLGRLGPIPSATGGIDRVAVKLSYGDARNLADGKRLAKADLDERIANERRNRMIVTSATALAGND